MPFSNNRNSRSGKPKRITRTNKGEKASGSRGRYERPERKENAGPIGSSKGFSKDQPKRPFDMDRNSRKDFSEDQSKRPYKKRDTRESGTARYGDHKERSTGSYRTDPRKRNKSEEQLPFRKREAGNTYSKEKSAPSIDKLNLRKKETRYERSHKIDDKIRLNRYIANSGVCSRRKADELIEAGVVSVNGEIVTTLGTKVDPSKDEVRYNGERLKREKMVYVLLNKPKDYITTTDDPQERRTVMHLVEKASRERIYPVGRLDRNTTGLLLMTNDGDLADKLSHPRNSITKIYHVELDKNLNQGDLNKIEFGLELEDGLIKPDTVSYVQGGSKREIGIQIHSGKNRIVRRIFEHLGYDIIKLDRVIYANLTKKDLPRGRWRYLEEKEIIQLKHFIK